MIAGSTHPMPSPAALFLMIGLAASAEPATTAMPTEVFEAPKYGITTEIPKAWPVADRENGDRVFVAP